MKNIRISFIYTFRIEDDTKCKAGYRLAIGDTIQFLLSFSSMLQYLQLVPFGSTAKMSELVRKV